MDDLNLKPNSVDLALMVDVYHEFSHPYEMMLSIAKALKKGGRIALVEYRGEDSMVPIKILHRMSMKQIKKEFAQPQFSLRFEKVVNILPRQHLVFFQKI